MSVIIDKNLCQACQSCLSVCPGDLLGLGTDGLAILEEPDRCWGCAACVKSCPYRAIALFLRPAMGGRGLLLTASREPQGPNVPGRLSWQAREGSFFWEIVTDPGQSQGY